MRGKRDFELERLYRDMPRGYGDARLKTYAPKLLTRSWQILPLSFIPFALVQNKFLARENSQRPKGISESL